ncbi:hypothetical protein PASE110613_08230 [Paenibacillus sediminis]|uniref:Glycosyltransferase n=1 Tax=Paenibacillus sediminis TaxID=664909 RepID=A0ABS4H2A7_9BACL|nr:hypothetical protein [Paenibacillus sediminis]MBP1936669.1 hypothetical protein [Paenibacillus sediminis]
MVPYLLWILLVYGLTAAGVHLLYVRHSRRNKAANKEAVHYVLVTSNHEKQIEWYIRALEWYSWIRGQMVVVTVVDERSTDHTIPIIERMSKHANGLQLSVISRSDLLGDDDLYSLVSTHKGEGVLLIDLRIPREALKIPYVHC